MKYKYAIRNGSLTRAWQKALKGNFTKLTFQDDERTTWVMTNDPAIALLALGAEDAQYDEEDPTVIVLQVDRWTKPSRIDWRWDLYPTAYKLGGDDQELLEAEALEELIADMGEDARDDEIAVLNLMRGEEVNA